jgi:hypothetical protein
MDDRRNISHTGVYKMIKEFIVDDFVMVGRKKFALNLNTYRNAHFHVLNEAKVNFKNKFYADNPDLYDIGGDKLKITYTIIPNDNRLFDTMNVISIVDKFILDALVSADCIPDDNYKCVSFGAPEVGEIVKGKCKKIICKCEFN